MGKTKGFTLIELLVVLAIVAILSVVVILTLNPAELLKQARDSNRISDLSIMRSAISLYLADANVPFIGTSTLCYVSVSAGVATSSGCGAFSAQTQTTSSATNNRKVDGTGWLPINFSSISSGAPIGSLPVDPSNTATLYYAYAASSTLLTFEINTVLESTKYDDYMTGDGGSKTGFYEVGTVPGLAL